MQQDPPTVVVNHPQGRVVGNRIVYGSRFNYNFLYCPTRKARIILGFFTVNSFLYSVLCFALGANIPGILIFFVFIGLLTICVYNFWRKKNEAMQRGAQMMYNQGPTQPVPGQSQQPTYPQYPYPQYPAQSYPTQPPYAMPYPPQSYPPNTTAPQAVSGQASSIQDAQPQIQSMATVPSAPSAPAGSSAEPPPPS